MQKKVLLVGVVVVLFMILLFGVSKERYCGTTGLTYEQGPLPDSIEEEAKSPPFYDIKDPRKPLCSYKNYMFPPPMEYGEYRDDCPGSEKTFQYWNTAMLSKPQTPYLV